MNDVWPTVIGLGGLVLVFAVGVLLLYLGIRAEKRQHEAEAADRGEPGA